jgi:hypothetical protein
MKLRHYRNGTELAPIAADDHYHFNYQKNRPLRQERKILPGDSMTFGKILIGSIEKVLGFDF